MTWDKFNERDEHGRRIHDIISYQNVREPHVHDWVEKVGCSTKDYQAWYCAICLKPTTTVRN